ncbi:MAG: hypothetical protein ABW215_17760 [Kibdelosporangium sp.]
MSWTSRDVETTVGMTVGRDTQVRFMVNQDYPGCITLILGDCAAEISFEPETLAALRDQADEAVRRARSISGP